MCLTRPGLPPANQTMQEKAVRFRGSGTLVERTSSRKEERDEADERELPLLWLERLDAEEPDE